jgi:uncharacterized protein (DUF488 family)
LHIILKILTAGYGNLGFDAFVARMREHGVTHIVDVRSVPQSAYWTDFRRENLEHLIPQAGFKYVYMGDTLGGVDNSPALCKSPESVELEPLFNRPQLQLGVEKLIRAATMTDRVICLMCGCLRPDMCHRSRLLAPALSSQGVEVLHIDADSELISQAQIESRRMPEQANLF